MRWGSAGGRRRGTPWRALVCAALVAGAAPAAAPAAAQRASVPAPPGPGAHVRLTVARRARVPTASAREWERRSGTVGAWARDTLTLVGGWRRAPAPVPLALVRRLEVRRPGDWRRGALVGLGLGVVAGGVAYLAYEPSSTCLGPCARGETAAGVALVLGAPAALLGAAATKYRWERVPLAGPR